MSLQINPVQMAAAVNKYGKAQEVEKKIYSTDYNVLHPFTVADLIAKLTYMAAKTQIDLNDIVMVNNKEVKLIKAKKGAIEIV